MIQKFLLLLFLYLLATPSNAAIVVYTGRSNFNGVTGNQIIDDYENAKYQHVMTDAYTSSVLGETTYFTYGGNINNYNNIIPGYGVGGGHSYCSLCYGSFVLSFGNATVTENGGVFAVGLDITYNTDNEMNPTNKHSANVTLVDGTTQLFQLPRVLDPSEYEFWGITSNIGIASVDFMAYSSTLPDRTFLHIDNLTIASPVPVPAGIWLFGVGLISLIGVGSRKRVSGPVVN